MSCHYQPFGPPTIVVRSKIEVTTKPTAKDVSVMKKAQAELLDESISLESESAEIDAESELMQALAEIDEDEDPDDRAVEIHSDNKYIG